MVNDGQFGDDIEDAASLVSPDAGAEVPPEQPEAADPQTAMLDALTRAMRDAPLPGAIDTPDDGQDEPDFELEDELDEQAEEDSAPAGGEHVPRTGDEWAEVILRDGPQRFAEVPRKLQADVARTYGDLRAKQAAVDAQTVVADYYQRLQRAADAVARVDEHFADDPDSKLAWLESDDPNAQVYVQLRNWTRQANSQPPQEQVAQVTALQQRALSQYERLKDYPEQQAELQSRAAQQRYSTSEDGVALLQADVDELLAQGIESRITKKAAPAKQRAAERHAGAQTRRAVPKPDVAPGRATRASPDISQINDPSELFAIGIRQSGKTGR